MAEGLKIYLPDDTTPATGRAFAGAAGVTTAEDEYHVHFDKGVPGDLCSDWYLQAEVEDPLNPGTYLISGHPALDEKWIRLRLEGGGNPDNDPRFVAESTDTVLLGLGAVLFAKDLPGNCYVKAFASVQAPMRPGVATTAFNWRLVARSGGVAWPCPLGLPDLGTGVLTHVGDRSYTGWVIAPTVTETGTPDDQVHVSRRYLLASGLAYRWLEEAVTLNQNDSAAAALGSGEEYCALLSQAPGSSTVTVTKGVKAASGTALRPALPAGESFGAVVTVPYGAGGSVIPQAAITVYAESGRMLPWAGTGLTQWIGHGSAVTRGGFVRFGKAQQVALPDNATTFVWLSADGGFYLTTTAAAPVSGAELLSEATTLAGAITAIVDHRRLLEPSRFDLVLSKKGAETVATNVADALCVAPVDGQIDRVLYAVRTAAAGGATGASTADVKKRHAGTAATIYTGGGGSPESRPTIPAGSYTDPASFPEVVFFDAGDFFEQDQAVICTAGGGTVAADAAVVLVCYPR